MKKHKQYEKFPEDIAGKIIKDNSEMKYYILASTDSTITILKDNKIVNITTATAFKDYIFLDGTPCGEEYDLHIELEHDKVYLVFNRWVHRWVPRHFYKRIADSYLFYDSGFSSKTIQSTCNIECWKKIIEYSEEIAFKPTPSRGVHFLINQ